MSLWATFPCAQDVIEASRRHVDRRRRTSSSNGPFTLTELVPKDHVTLVPNPNWSGQKPALQEITIKFIDDLSAAFRPFQTDELRR